MRGDIFEQIGDLFVVRPAVEIFDVSTCTEAGPRFDVT
jgi:hypothetical protein